MSVINRTIKSNANGVAQPYTVPSGKTAVVTSISHCNHTSSATSCTTYIFGTTYNSSTQSYTIINNMSQMAANTTVEIIGGGQKLVLNANEGLVIAKAASNTVDTIITLMEID